MVIEEKNSTQVMEDKDFIPNFRKKIMHLRTLLRLSQGDFSKAFGIARSYLHKIENRLPIGENGVLLKSPSKKIIDMIYDRLQIDKNLFEERVSFEEFEESLKGRELKILNAKSKFNNLDDYQQGLQAEITNLNSMMSKDKEGMPLISPPLSISQENEELKKRIKTLEEKIEQLTIAAQEERKQMMETIQTLAKQ